MNVLGLSGAHRTGNTDMLVEHALEVCAKQGLDTKFISLADLDVDYCTVCDGCKSKDSCVMNDDAEMIFSAMQEADALIIGTPTYFASVSSKLKALLDRTRALRRKRALAGKIGAAVAVGASRNGGQEHAISAIHNWMLLQEMMIVSDKKTAHFGGIAVAAQAGEVAADAVGLETTANTAQQVSDALAQKSD